MYYTTFFSYVHEFALKVCRAKDTKENKYLSVIIISAFTLQALA